MQGGNRLSFARNAPASIKDANSTESTKIQTEPVISLLEEQRGVKTWVPVMRLGHMADENHHRAR